MKYYYFQVLNKTYRYCIYKLSIGFYFVIISQQLTQQKQRSMLRQYSTNRLDNLFQRRPENTSSQKTQKAFSNQNPDIDFFLPNRSKQSKENIQISFNPFEGQKQELDSSKNSDSHDILLLSQSYQNRNYEQSLTKYIYNPKKEKKIYDEKQTNLQIFLQQSNLCPNCAKYLMGNCDFMQIINEEKIVLQNNCENLEKELQMIYGKIKKYQEEVKYQDTVIKEKGQIIMKMSNFNDQLCHKLIDLQSYIAHHQDSFNNSSEQVNNVLNNNNNQPSKLHKQNNFLQDSGILDYLQIVKKYSQFIDSNIQMQSHIQQSSLDISLTNKFKNPKPCQQFLSLIQAMDNKNIHRLNGKIQLIK